MNKDEYYHFKTYGGVVHHLVDPTTAGQRHALCGTQCYEVEPIYYLKVPMFERECKSCLKVSYKRHAKSKIAKLTAIRLEVTHNPAPYISDQAHNEYIMPMAVEIEKLKDKLADLQDYNIDLQRRLKPEALSGETRIRLHAKIRRQATALNELQALRAKEHKTKFFSFVPDKKPNTERKVDIQFLKEGNAYLRGVLQERDARIVRQSKELGQLRDAWLNRGTGSPGPLFDPECECPDKGASFDGWHAKGCPLRRSTV
jgi:hypothetical protein